MQNVKYLYLEVIHLIARGIKVQVVIQILPSNPILLSSIFLFRGSVLRGTVQPLCDACFCTSEVWISTEVGIPPTCFLAVNTPKQPVKNVFIAFLTYIHLIIKWVWKHQSVAHTLYSIAVR